MVSLLPIYSVCISASSSNKWNRASVTAKWSRTKSKTLWWGIRGSVNPRSIETEYWSINTQIDYAEVNLVNAMANLRYVMNIQPDAVLYLEDSIQHYAEETLDYLGSYQYINLPEYRVLEINDQLRYYDIAQARAQLYPSIYLFGYYGVLAQRSSFHFSKRDQTIAGLTLEQQLYGEYSNLWWEHRKNANSTTRTEEKSKPTRYRTLTKKDLLSG